MGLCVFPLISYWQSSPSYNVICLPVWTLIYSIDYKIIKFTINIKMKVITVFHLRIKTGFSMRNIFLNRYYNSLWEVRRISRIVFTSFPILKVHLRLEESSLYIHCIQSSFLCSQIFVQCIRLDNWTIELRLRFENMDYLKCGAKKVWFAKLGKLPVTRHVSAFLFSKALQKSGPTGFCPTILSLYQVHS